MDRRRGIPRRYGNGRCVCSWISWASTIHSGRRSNRELRRANDIPRKASVSAEVILPISAEVKIPSC